MSNRRSLTRGRTWLVASGLVLAACASAREPAPAAPAPSTTSGAAAPTTTVGEARPPAAPFDAAIVTIDDRLAARMRTSWRPGCPLPLEQLRLVTLTHWGFDGRIRRGELVVHVDDAEGVVGAFRALFDARFPIEQVRLVDDFGGDDDRSMAANNTSAFN